MTQREIDLLDYMYGQAENLKAYMEEHGFTDCKAVEINLLPNNTQVYNKKPYTYDAMEASITYNDGGYIYRGYSPVYDRSFYGEY